MGYSERKQLGFVALLLKGKDVTSVAPNDLGCAETVSRMIRVLHPDFPVITGTSALRYELDACRYIAKTTVTGNGTIHLAETGRGQYPHGHVGIEWNGLILSNNSLTGKVDSHMTVGAFEKYYFIDGRFPRKYYQLIA